jgi:hypothetical protein
VLVAQVGADELDHLVGDRRICQQPGENRIGPMRILDAPHPRIVRPMGVLQIVDGIAGVQPA